MRILISGKDGQVARSFAERAAGHELIFAARPQLDLTDFASIERSVRDARPDLVISAAAYTGVDKAEDEPELALRVNGDAPGVLARAAARENAPILHLSTDYVFNGALDRPWREDDPIGPISVYGVSKLAGEEAIAASGATFAILRTAWVYSPFGANFVRTMLRLAEERDELNVVQDQAGSPTSAYDIADALQSVIAAWQRASSHGANAIYHVAGTGETTWAEFARAIFEESAARAGPSARVNGIPTSGYPTKAARPANSRLDCARFRAVFGYRCPEWRESLAVVVARLLAGG